MHRCHFSIIIRLVILPPSKSLSRLQTELDRRVQLRDVQTRIIILKCSHTFVFTLCSTLQLGSHIH
ncbi:hypothetical protein PF005_g13313 [Phytophthora fragariae]|uniref:Uncharacterized protein n=1 Tax=Phytophthora fragariae TaxID=53985 RepID=A0A6A3QDW5_9STRA|nr:hypothetical protein PF003_g28766 [Phytophthora fragariae]KAE8940740.1 hypothetical protein PF009_g9456 [Phytophthora fragariae]KAE9003239.1 hypothetical protein PF011_g12982 [Phytophthora fragariae]KAE9074158.1 hypothetical protein PF007_g25520 [Phytophthora fragariae]KAE9078833.1 hypothetical protein PF006_g27636 [Phytophthora fragariae]